MVVMDIFNKINEATIITDKQILQSYCHDESHITGALPLAVIKPRSLDAIYNLVQIAKQEGLGLIARGAGTGKAGGCLAIQRDIIIDMTDYVGQIYVSKSDLCLTAPASYILKDVKKAALDHGLMYPPDPNSWDICTFGGSLATNAGGPCSCKYGMTRNWVLSVDAIMDDGKVHSFGISSVKCNTGPSFSQLLVGSEGIFGIIIGATVRLIPKPNNLLTLLLPVEQWYDLLDLPSKLFSAGYLPCAFEFWDPDVIHNLRLNGPEVARRMPGIALALLEFDDPDCQSEAFLNGLLDVLGPLADYLQLAMDAKQRAAIWSIRRITSTHIKEFYPKKISEDIVIPRSNIKTFFTSIKEMSIPIVTYGHLGDGNLHINLLEAGNIDINILECQLNDLLKLCIDVGGAISGEHGIGLAKKEAFIKFTDPYHIKSLQSIKYSLDPNCIFNPGKII